MGKNEYELMLETKNKEIKSLKQDKDELQAENKMWCDKILKLELDLAKSLGIEYVAGQGDALPEKILSKIDALLQDNKDLKKDCADMASSYCATFVRCRICGSLRDKGYVCHYGCKEY